MRRFFLPKSFSKDSTVTIDDSTEIHHLKNVLRLKEGQDIEIFNNDGLRAQARILEIHPTEISLKVIAVQKEEKKSGREIILACAMPKKSKFETIIEKTTELGVSEIIPLQTYRTQIQLTGDRLNKKKERFEKVAVNAAKQSKRSNVPIVRDVSGFEATVDDLLKRATVIIPSLEGAPKLIREVFAGLTDQKPIAFLVGPEGDFTKEEYAYARKKGCLAVSLGETTLKVETAAISCVAFCNFYFCK